MIRHQTRKRIEALGDAHRPPSSLKHHLGLLVDVIRDRDSRTPGLNPSEKKKERREQEIREIYEEETRCGPQQMVDHVKALKLFTFDRFDYSGRFQIDVHLAPRAYERGASSVHVPAHQASKAGVVSTSNTQPQMASTRRSDQAAHPPTFSGQVDSVNTPTQIGQPQVGKWTEEHQQRADCILRESSEIGNHRQAAKFLFRQSTRVTDIPKKTEKLLFSTLEYKEADVGTLRLQQAKLYWRELLNDDCVRAEDLTPEVAGLVPDLEDHLRRIAVLKRTIASLRWRCEKGLNLSPDDHKHFADVLAERMAVLTASLDRSRAAASFSLQLYNECEAVEI